MRVMAGPGRWWGIAALAALACGGGVGEGEDPAVARGREVYLSICTACHNADPSRDGSQGPAVAGSSLELLRARVLTQGYPPGYTPKRDTLNMVPLPHVEKDLPALAAYLASVVD